MATRKQTLKGNATGTGLGKDAKGATKKKAKVKKTSRGK